MIVCDTIKTLSRVENCIMDKMKKLKRRLLVNIICIVCIFLFAIYGLELLFYKSKYSISIDRDPLSGVDVKIEIESKKDLSTDIIVYVDDVKYSVSVTEVDKNIYRGTLHLSKDYFMMYEQDVLVKCYDVDGQQIKIEKNSFGKDFSIVLGRIVLIVIATMSTSLTVADFVRKRKQLDKEKNSSAKFDVFEKASHNTFNKKAEKYCRYCGCKNNEDSQKCHHCHAPFSE